MATATAIFISVGSRGDLDPLVALAEHLLSTSAFTTVHLNLSPDYVSQLSPTEGLVLHPHPTLSLSSFRAAMRDAKPTTSSMLSSVISECLPHLLPPLNSQIREHRPCLLLATTLAAALSFILSSMHHIPFALLHMQPNTPTAFLPNYILSPAHAAAAANAAVFPISPEQPNPQHMRSHIDHLTEMFAPFLTLCASTRPAFQSQSITNLMPALHGNLPSVVNLHAYSRRLIMPTHDLPSSVINVGPLTASYIPSSFCPARHIPRLHTLMSSKPPDSRPIIISIGSTSLPASRQIPVAHALFSALHITCPSSPIIELHGKGSSALADTFLNSSQDRKDALYVWVVQNVVSIDEHPPFPWLLPQTDMLICHGGAGTVSSALRANTPVVVCPHLGDQFLWGELLHLRDCGAIVRPSLAQGNVAELSRAITHARSIRVRRNLAALSKALREEPDPCQQAAAVLKRFLTATRRKS